jgi:hypothetical protein
MGPEQELDLSTLAIDFDKIDKKGVERLVATPIVGFCKECGWTEKFTLLPYVTTTKDRAGLSIFDTNLPELSEAGLRLRTRMEERHQYHSQLRNSECNGYVDIRVELETQVMTQSAAA